MRSVARVAPPVWTVSVRVRTTDAVKEHSAINEHIVNFHDVHDIVDLNADSAINEQIVNLHDVHGIVDLNTHSAINEQIVNLHDAHDIVDL